VVAAGLDLNGDKRESKNPGFAGAAAFVEAEFIYL
jgi:hypothetical protein